MICCCIAIQRTWFFRLYRVYYLFAVFNFTTISCIYFQQRICWYWWLLLIFIPFLPQSKKSCFFFKVKQVYYDQNKLQSTNSFFIQFCVCVNWFLCLFFSWISNHWQLALYQFCVCVSLAYTDENSRTNLLQWC